METPEPLAPDSWRPLVDGLRGAASPTIYVVGPTASGKSALALEIAECLGAEILSADSRQIYRGMDIGTAKPGIAERRGIPHHLIDVTTPDVRFTLADFLGLARPILRAASAEHRPLVITGGTGLYVNALLYRYELPDGSDASVRERLTERPLADLLRELDQLSPKDGAHVDRQNRRRVERALGYVLATGSSFHEQQLRSTRQPESLVLGLHVEPKLLDERIRERVNRMVERGLADEVRGLHALYGDEAPGLQSIGYAELFPFLAGTLSLQEAIEGIITHTRQYAKRQRTWFRRTEDIVWMRCV